MNIKEEIEKILIENELLNTLGYNPDAKNEGKNSIEELTDLIEKEGNRRWLEGQELGVRNERKKWIENYLGDYVEKERASALEGFGEWLEDNHTDYGYFAMSELIEEYLKTLEPKESEEI